MESSRRRVSWTSLGLAFVMVLGMILGPIPVAYAAMPTPTVGAAYDGVDFAALSTPGNGIYYGMYDHATSLASGNWGVATLEGTNRPILWQIRGEQVAKYDQNNAPGNPVTESAGNNPGQIALLSQYVLDSRQYDASEHNNYSGSAIRQWLNTTSAGGFMGDHFTGAERQGLTETKNLRTTNSMDVFVTYSDDTVYLLNWDANSVAELDHINSIGGGGNPNAQYRAYLRNDPNATTPVDWWLRSPDSFTSYLALYVPDTGSVNNGIVDDILGVRPASKLNPTSVIFASEIGGVGSGATAADSNYSAAGGGAKNFKLTILDSTLSAGAVAAGGQAITGNPTLTTTPGGTIPVTGSGAASGTNLTYKIVDNSRNIVGYGQGTNASLTVSAQDLAGANLTAGNYTVYVWAQANENINSHRGSTPQYFTMTVGSPVAPAITSANSYACPASTGGTLQVIATGNPSVFTYSLSGEPTGVSIDAAGLMTVSSAVPEGTYNFSVNVANGVLPNASQAFSLTVTTVTTAPAITSANSLSIVEGAGGSFRVTATGNPSTFTYSLTGAPAGVSMDTAGLMTVTNAVPAGTYNFTVGVDNTINPPASQAFTLTVSALTSRTLTDATTGSTVAGSFTTNATLTSDSILHPSGCSACDTIRSKQAAGEIVVMHNLFLSAGTHGGGDVTVSIPMNPQLYEGQPATIYHCASGTLETFNTTVANGRVGGTFSSLSPFAVAATAKAVVSNNTANPRTGDDIPVGLLITLIVVAGAGMTLGIRRRFVKS